MAFTKVPTESKKQINKAGKILAENKPNGISIEQAIALVDKWRACHAYPINTFQATLRRKLNKFTNSPIVAQRLKRMPTIIGKLKKNHSMQLTTMQDIGGIRAVMNSIDDVYKLASEYREESRFAHELKKENDYISKPRDEDGYRSLHLIYRYKNKKIPEYDGLLLELQIRTKLQHAWATAVETMGTFLGQALKSRQGDRAWLDFFALVSSAFAHIEESALIPKHATKSKKETFIAVAKMNEELKVLDKIKGYSVAVNEIVKRGDSDKSWSYHLIILNSIEKNVQIKPYKREGFKQAIADYGKVEEQAAKGEKIEAVLVSAGPLATLRQAYPNFFLDISDFVKHIEDIIKESKIT